MTARVPREHASRFHRHLTLMYDEYERNRFPNTMDILNEFTEEEFELVTSQVRRLSQIAIMLEDVSEMDDPNVRRLLDDAAFSKAFNEAAPFRRRSSVERERRANEICKNVLCVFGILIILPFVLPFAVKRYLEILDTINLILG